MGFMDAKFATTALLNIKGPITAKSYNKAVRSLKNIHTDILCKPWYVGNALPYHIPNNTDITVDYKDGKVVAEGEVLRHRAGRQGARPDPDLGEEVQAEHEVEKRSPRKTTDHDDQGAPETDTDDPPPRLERVRRGMEVPQALHRDRAGVRGRVRALGRRPGRALPGHRGAEPRVRRHRCRGCPDRLLPRHPHGRAALARLHGLRAHGRSRQPRCTGWCSAPPSHAATRSSR